MVRTGLEVHVERRTTGIARLLEGVHFGVRLARRMVVTLADHATIAHNDRTDERVGPGAPGSACREAQRATHVRGVRLAHG